MSNFSYTNPLVLGLGSSGLAMARWCAMQGARVTVVDTRTEPPCLVKLQQTVENATFQHSEFVAELLVDQKYDLLLISPGIKPSEVSALIDLAKQDGIQIANELDLFTDAVNLLKTEKSYNPKIIAITGTNGKTTVTTLTAKLVKASGIKVAMAGNIGPSLLDTLMLALDNDELPDVWVLELSSFQLYKVQQFNPSAGVVLNITEDHLDWHADMQEYVASKCNVYGAGTAVFVNRDEGENLLLVSEISRQSSASKTITFGLDAPIQTGDYGVVNENGVKWLSKAIAEDGEPVKRRNALPREIFMQKLMPVDALQIKGNHNISNALIALALAEHAGANFAASLFALREYKGEPHRVEFIKNVNGIDFYNDSKGTNVGATIAAVDGLSSSKNIVLILGGEGKGQNFHPLVQPLMKYAKCIIIFGKDKKIINDALFGHGLNIVFADTLQQALDTAVLHAITNDIVLLSPACASFDMFENYQHRGDTFKGYVNKIQAITSLEVTA